LSKKTFYITTAIDYPNGTPHLGHALEKVVTDTYTRFERLLGHEAFFLTGTDENGQKLVKSAEALGKETLQFVDENVVHFKQLCEDLNAKYDDFIRTSELRHHKVAQDFWSLLEKKGFITFDKYAGNYCISCEAFYTDLLAPNGLCPEHGKKLERVEEEGYFLKTSQFQSWIIEHIKNNPSFVVPSAAKTEILSRLEAEPMKDLSISRPNKGWGITVPGNGEHVMYTWFDALINYYTATQNPSGREHLWPADVHVIGRDILWFHAVIWPIMLHSAGIALPQQIYVHGMILAEDGKKMSKSLGNGLEPKEVLSQVSCDSFRYYLLRAIPAGANGAFIFSDLLKRRQSELGNDYGNMLMRIVKLARKRIGDSVSCKGVTIAFDFQQTIADVTASMNAREHNRALDRIWLEVNRVNAYVNDQAPWAIKEDEVKFTSVIANALYGLDVVSQLLTAYIPEAATTALSSLGHVPGVLTLVPRDFVLSDPPVLFPRLEGPAS
jgi:methionyl-tRNA synthetase